jgi:hypothetical protein
MAKNGISVWQQEHHLIQPKDIDPSDHLFDAFGKMEIEICAGWIIRFLQDRNDGWKPFTHVEIDEFYRREQRGHINSDWLSVSGWIYVGSDKKYHVTHDFICQCYRASPVKQEELATA